MQTKFGAKLNILVDRSIDAWNGTQETYEKTKQSNKAENQLQEQQHQVSQADTLDTNRLLPNNRNLTSMPMKQETPQESPDFNQMYQNTVTPLQDAAEPIAANEGGTMFGSW